MSKEIKFRAFHKSLKLMLPVHKLSLTEPVLIYSRHDNKEIINTLDDCELMQFTGLKDKEGVDIYEGDIVDASCEGELDTSHLVAWNACNCSYPAFDLVGWDGEANGFSDALEGDHYQLEVTGNIHENPELWCSK